MTNSETRWRQVHRNADARAPIARHHPVNRRPDVAIGMAVLILVVAVIFGTRLLG